MPQSTLGNRRVWYVSYGSNMDAARFDCYLRGGTPPGAARAYPGCRDQRPPAADRPVHLPGGIYFAGESRTWTGGVAYYEPELPGAAPARAYLVTGQQFADVAAQEMHRAPGAELDLDAVRLAGRHAYGPGRYETLLSLEAVDGVPSFTFTAPGGPGAFSPPAAGYLRTLATGLAESHGWSAARVGEYLAAVPGARGHWTAAQAARLTETG